MYAVVQIGEQAVPMMAMASVDLYYRTIFHEDPIKLQTRTDDAGELIEFLMHMGFVMAKFAALRSRKAMCELTEDDYIDWLDGFSRADYLDALDAVSDVYNGQQPTTADAKKKEAAASAS